MELRHQAKNQNINGTFIYLQILRQYEHTGTVFGAINKKQFEAMGFIEPSPDLIRAFEERIGPLDDEITHKSEI